jgi:signal transduction histidine kinase
MPFARKAEKRTLLSGLRGNLSVPQKRYDDRLVRADGPIREAAMSATTHPETRQPPADFVAAHETLAHQALFAARFTNWRVSVSAGAAFGATVTGLYYYLTRDPALFIWLGLHTGAYAWSAVMCLIVESRDSLPPSPEYQYWQYAWTVASGATGAITGSLLWWLPPDRSDLLLSATVIVSLAAVGQIVARAYRPMVYTAIACQTAALCAALALHTDLLWMLPIVILFAVFALLFGLALNGTMLQAIMQRLYAQHLASELMAAHQNELKLEQLHAAQVERERMMADMHDGLGSTLLSALVLLDRRELSVTAAADVVRECVDDLRLIVDSREPAARDLSTLVGMFRFRYEPRIQAAGIRLHWQMEDLAHTPQLDPTSSLHLLRILQEAVANALQHSEAKDIELSTRQVADAIELAVRDNGKGFDEHRVTAGRGLSNMRSRAERLHARLSVDSAPGRGTTVSVRLPVAPA